ncbi:MAG: 2-hydroxyacyl-CoA dehydratase [Candidatus Freyarchaeota archaeon]
MGGLAPPDFLVVARKFCKTHVKWWQVLSRRFNCPLFIIDAPYVPEDEKEYHVEHYVSQLEDLITFLEERTGRKMDYDKLREVVKLSDRASKRLSSSPIERACSGTRLWLSGRTLPAP